MTATTFAAKLAAKREAKNGAGKAAAPPTLSPPKLTPDTSGGTITAAAPSDAPMTEAVSGSAPPWAVEACPACKGCGINTKGRPCKICQHNSDILSTLYDLDTGDDGMMTWISKTDPDDCGVSPCPGAVSTKVSEKDAATEPTPTNDADQGAEETKPKRTRKPRKSKAVATDDNGFMLCVNCGPIRGDTDNVVYLSELLHVLGPIMAEQGEVESFYDINVFDRRDGLAKAGESIVETYLQGKLVVAEGIGTGASDTRSLLDAIRPFASLVLSPNIV